MLEKMVPRDGVEPPTPAFSGLHSTKGICLIQQNLASPHPGFWTCLLEA